MIVQPVICKEAQVLIELIRLALGAGLPDKDKQMPLRFDWDEVIRLSYNHKVSALAVDGLQKLELDYKVINTRQSKDTEILMATWFNDLVRTEQGYEYYLEINNTLCQIFQSEGLKPIILKGLGLNLNYPIPSHRGVGDIDIFLIDTDGKCAAKKANEIVKKRLNTPIRHEDSLHHSVFDFKGIRVENHYVLVSHSFSSDEDEYLRRMLERILINESYKYDEKSSIYLPSVNFNAIALIQHMYAHYYNDKMNLRQICDYLMLIKNHYLDVDWSLVSSILLNSGLNDFARGINSMLLKYLSLCDLCTNDFFLDEEYGNHIIADTFKSSNKYGIANIKHYYNDRWKIKHLYNENWLVLTLKSVMRNICNSKN